MTVRILPPVSAAKQEQIVSRGEWIGEHAQVHTAHSTARIWTKPSRPEGQRRKDKAEAKDRGACGAYPL